MALLVAAQRDERQRALASIDAGLSTRHAAQAAAVIARFAGKRAALSTTIDGPSRAVALQQLAADETAELVRLAVEHVNEKRRQRQTALSALAATHRAARKSLSTRQRHQRIAFALALRSWPPSINPGTHHAVRWRPAKARWASRRRPVPSGPPRTDSG